MAAVFDSLNDKALISLINQGSVGVIPTDTLYGLVCQASNPAAVKRLYGLKNRKNKPGTLIAASIEQLVKLGFKQRYLKPVEHFWPGAISIVIPSGDSATSYMRCGVGSIPVRLPKDSKLEKLLLKTGPLLTTSANIAGENPANTIEQAAIYFGGKVDFYVDSGNLKDRQPSTIVRIVDDAIEVLRPGAVKIKNNEVDK